jgi:hypothetical protein
MSSNELELKILRDKLNDLEEFQQIEIFKIIQTNDVSYSKNNNGIFLNMKLLNDNCITSINDYLIFIQNNKN